MNDGGGGGYQEECEFCRICAGLEPGSIVYSDQAVVAFLDYMPINPGHTLIVPRTHATNLAELDPADGSRMFELAQKLAAGIRASPIASDGINLILNDGAPAGQRVFHAHLHVIPRIKGDSLRRNLDAAPIPQTELGQVASMIRQQIL